MKIRKHPVVAGLEGEIGSTLQDFGYELVLMKFGGPPGNRTLSIFIDKPGGLTADDCKYMSDRLSIVIDALDPIEGSYRLVVSSPGVDRPLTRDEDFEKFAGETVSVRFEDEAGKRRRIRGTLQGVREGKAVILADGEEEAVALDQVEEGNLIYDWAGHGEPEAEATEEAAAPAPTAAPGPKRQSGGKRPKPKRSGD
jgi:ribosome maturation factor RimP